MTKLMPRSRWLMLVWMAPLLFALSASAAASGSGASQTRWGGLASSIPDVPVLDQDGRPVKFYSDLVKGNTVVINFVFTSCTTVCPPLTAILAKTQQDLGKQAGRGAHLISISIDPVNDTPERLKKYAAHFDIESGWTFVTGDKADIDRLLKALGAFAGNRNDHTPLTLIGNDAANAWTRIYGLAAPATLVTTIREALALVKSDAQFDASPANGTLGKVAEPPANPTGDCAETLEDKSPSQSGAKYFTNLPLVDQNNERVRFYDDLIKGHVVLINFVFTGCTSICSPATANLKRVQDALGATAGNRVQIISISVDPVNDTPAVLNTFAAEHGVQPGWRFLTGKKENIDWIAYKLGGYVEDKLEHSTVLIIGNDQTGEWMKTLALAKPSEIVDAVRRIGKF